MVTREAAPPTTIGKMGHHMPQLESCRSPENRKLESFPVDQPTGISTNLVLTDEKIAPDYLPGTPGYKCTAIK